MNFDLSEEQRMLRGMARDFLAAEFPKDRVRQLEDDGSRYDLAIWRKMAQLGWIGLTVPSEYGGTGASFLDLVMLLEEMGRACLIAPFFSTVMCASMIVEGGNANQRLEFLPHLAAGRSLFTMALTEPSASYDATGIAASATKCDDNFIINGTKLFVHDAEAVDYFICAARVPDEVTVEDSVALFIVDAKSAGITVRLLPTMADDREYEVIFENVAVRSSRMLSAPGRGWQTASRFLERAAVGKCAEMIGGAEWALEACVSYSKVRAQYGKPIGSFQALQHYMAEMWTEIGHAKQLVYQAAWDIDQGLPSAQHVAMAKARVSDGYRQWTARGVQIHGGIGITREFDMGLYYRRARQSNALFGSPDFWREKVAVGLGL